ncbi:SDR family NAD(P)-dependent oxidoreductase [Litoribacter populi]|uniref:SDR family NAD(P)-dependent oxidoreductase n=1 Tax=Litoribacter populi TaxID=2598460 RepID=UPI00117E2720|nr:SDR family oxidoreductase [Litoribacter populi]
MKGKSAIITGGASGIGLAISERFAKEGASVIMLDFNIQAGEKVESELVEKGYDVTFLSCDVSKQSAVKDVFAQLKAPVDILVNNAGVSHVGNIENTSEEDFDRLFQINVKGVYNCTQEAIAQMKGRGGVILNMASIVALVGIPDRFAYSMTKGAVLSMTLSVACDYIKEGIRCNCISPARVHTPFVDDFLSKNYPGKEQEMFEKLAQTQPIGRMGSTKEVASLAYYICSDEAAFITGTNYPVDGGFLHLKP